MASLVSSLFSSPVRLSVYLCARTSRTLSSNGRLGQRRSCPGEGAALCRSAFNTSCTNPLSGLDSMQRTMDRSLVTTIKDLHLAEGDLRASVVLVDKPSLLPVLLCRRPAVSPRGNGARGFFSRGGGPVEDQKTLQDIAEDIRERRYEKVVVMAGAGISTPSGIPDFRSPGSGLYDNLQQYDLPYAEAIFELRFFHHNPRPFFALAKELYPGNYRPNVTHYFVRLLHEKSQLLRMYTQNIDGLERLAGIPPEMLVEAHGTFATATCTVCLREYQGEELRADVMSGTVPHCPTCGGVVKPDIVFFGEELPRHFFKYHADFPRADLLVVMGTSLEVEPFASLAGAAAASVPRLLINRDPVGPFAGRCRAHDVLRLGDVVEGVRALVDALGWTRELDALMAAAALKAETKTEE